MGSWSQARMVPNSFTFLPIWLQQMGEWIRGREFQDTTGHPPGKALQAPQNNLHWFHSEGPRACKAGLILEHTHRICLHNFLDLEGFLFALVRKAVQIYHVKQGAACP